MTVTTIKRRALAAVLAGLVIQSVALAAIRTDFHFFSLVLSGAAVFLAGFAVGIVYVLRRTNLDHPQHQP